VLLPLTSAASWPGDTSGEVIRDWLDCATSNDTGSGVVGAGEVVTGVVVTVVVECGCVIFVVVFVHPTALTSIITTIRYKNIFFILNPRLSVAFATIITFENGKG
jgi:hypothetical protein